MIYCICIYIYIILVDISHPMSPASSRLLDVLPQETYEQRLGGLQSQLRALEDKARWRNCATGWCPPGGCLSIFVAHRNMVVSIAMGVPPKMDGL